MTHWVEGKLRDAEQRIGFRLRKSEPHYSVHKFDPFIVERLLFDKSITLKVRAALYEYLRIAVAYINPGSRQFKEDNDFLRPLYRRFALCFQSIERIREEYFSDYSQVTICPYLNCFDHLYKKRLSGNSVLTPSSKERLQNLDTTPVA